MCHVITINATELLQTQVTFKSRDLGHLCQLINHCYHVTHLLTAYHPLNPGLLNDRVSMRNAKFILFRWKFSITTSWSRIPLAKTQRTKITMMSTKWCSSCEGKNWSFLPNSVKDIYSSMASSPQHLDCWDQQNPVPLLLQWQRIIPPEGPYLRHLDSTWPPRYPSSSSKWVLKIF